MSAILEAYASDDRRHVDYAAISKSEEFRRYYWPISCCYNFFSPFIIDSKHGKNKQKRHKKIE